MITICAYEAKMVRRKLKSVHVRLETGTPRLNESRSQKLTIQAQHVFYMKIWVRCWEGRIWVLNVKTYIIVSSYIRIVLVTYGHRWRYKKFSLFISVFLRVNDFTSFILLLFIILWICLDIEELVFFTYFKNIIRNKHW